MKIISSGSQYEVYPDDLKTHDKLPALTYKINFDKFRGFYLTQIDDLVCSEEKIYGVHEQKAQKISQTFSQIDRSLGVILSGDKGIGKTMTVQLLAMEMQENDFPVIVVDSGIPGIVNFIDSIKQKALIVFDEFEKKFPTRSGERVSQEDFLSLFDGMSNHNHLYVITVNDINNLSSYLLNRPGRFHYHIRYTYPDRGEIIEYLKDKTENVSSTEIGKVADFGFGANLNFDMLRAIAFELNTGARFENAIKDLNIINIDQRSTSDFILKLTDGTTFEGKARVMSIGMPGEIELDYYAPNTKDIYGKIFFEFGQILKDNTGFTIPHSAIIDCDISYESENDYDERRNINSDQIDTFSITTMTTKQKFSYTF